MQSNEITTYELRNDIDLEEYQKNIFFTELEKSKQDYKNGRFKNARQFFKELEGKYGY